MYTKSQKQKILFTSLTIVISICYSLIGQIKASGKTNVYIFDIGQGLSQFIKTKEGVDIVIDTGPDSLSVSKINNVMGFFDKHIDILVLTHAHADHISGTLKILDTYEVGKVILTKAMNDSLTYKYILDELELRHIPIEYAESYKKYEIDSDTYFEILFPVIEAPTQVENPNNWSVVSRFVDNNKSILFPGDAEEEEEQLLLQQGYNLDSDYLIAGHHGSKTSSTPELLKAVTPSTVIISSGSGNDYGHPHKEVLERLYELGIRVLRTDEVGDVVISF